jgi:SAM-dependent methyltransferase
MPLLKLDHAIKKLSPRQKWDQRYVELHPAARLAPTPFVQSVLKRLPSRGRALDIAAGAGRHAIALARHGLRVDAVDISWEGLRLALNRAAEAGVADRVNGIVADVERTWLPHSQYEVILVSYFLYRPLFSLIEQRLRPGGLLVYETFTVGELANPKHSGSGRPEFYLQSQELREAFSNRWEVLFYEEGDHHGRMTAQLLARKPGEGIGHD